MTVRNKKIGVLVAAAILLALVIITASRNPIVSIKYYHFGFAVDFPDSKTRDAFVDRIEALLINEGYRKLEQVTLPNGFSGDDDDDEAKDGTQSIAPLEIRSIQFVHPTTKRVLSLKLAERHKGIEVLRGEFYCRVYTRKWDDPEDDAPERISAYTRERNVFIQLLEKFPDVKFTRSGAYYGNWFEVKSKYEK